MSMSLAETLLGSLAVLAITAASYFPYQTIRELRAERSCQEALVLLKANVDDIYGDWYGMPGFGDPEAMTELNVIPAYFTDPRLFPSKFASPATIWGPVAISASENGREWSVAFQGLNGRACIHFARFRYRDWKRVQIGDKPVWTRSEGVPAKPSRLEELCSAEIDKSGSATVSFIDGI